MSAPRLDIAELRASIDECRKCGVRFIELTTDEQDALVSIAEAAEAWRNVPKEPLHMDEIVKRAAALCAAVDAALAAVRKEGA